MLLRISVKEADVITGLWKTGFYPCLSQKFLRGQQLKKMNAQKIAY
jgi:hypothetical protein